MRIVPQSLAARAKPWAATAIRYLTLTSLVTRELVSLFPLRCLWIVISGILGFVLKAASILVLIRLLVSPERAGAVLSSRLGVDLSNLEIMLLATSGALSVYMAGNILEYLSHLWSAHVARDYAQEALRRTMKARVRLYAPVPLRLLPADTPTALSDTTMRPLNFIHRTVDACSRIFLLTTPKIFSSLAALCFLLYLDWQMTFTVIALVACFSGVMAWQSARGLDSRKRLEVNVPKAVAARRAALEMVENRDARLEDVERKIDQSIDEGPGKQVSKEYAFQFIILFESNAATSLLSVVMLGLVLTLLLLQVGFETAAGAKGFWVSAGTYIIGLRFLASELTPVTRSFVSISRLYEHLSSYARVIQFENNRASHRSPSHSAAPLQVLLRSEQAAKLTVKQSGQQLPDRTGGSASTPTGGSKGLGQLVLTSGVATQFYLPGKMSEFDFGTIREFIQPVADGAKPFSPAQAEMRIVSGWDRQSEHGETSLRKFLRLSPDAHGAAIKAEINRLDLDESHDSLAGGKSNGQGPGRLGEMLDDLDAGLTLEELEQLSIWDSAVIKLADASCAAAEVVVADADFIEKLWSISASNKKWLEALLAKKIFFMVADDDQPTAPMSKPLPYAAVLTNKQVAWLGEADTLDLQRYRELRKSQQKKARDEDDDLLENESIFTDM